MLRRNAAWIRSVRRVSLSNIEVEQVQTLGSSFLWKPLGQSYMKVFPIDFNPANDHWNVLSFPFGWLILTVKMISFNAMIPYSRINDPPLKTRCTHWSKLGIFNFIQLCHREWIIDELSCLLTSFFVPNARVSLSWKLVGCILMRTLRRRLSFWWWFRKVPSPSFSDWEDISFQEPEKDCLRLKNLNVPLLVAITSILLACRQCASLLRLIWSRWLKCVQ